MSVPADVESQTKRERLAADASRAIGWSFLNTVVSRLGTLGVGIVLARVLGPEAFGTFAVATVALLAVLSFNDLGVSLALVRWRDDPTTIAPTVTTIAVVTSLLLYGAVYLAAPSFSAAMGDPSASTVVRLMAVALVINALVATPAALLQREFQQGRRMAADQVNTWLGALVSLVLALSGWGAMSLAVGRLVGSAVSGLLLVLWSPAPLRFGFDPAVARALTRFGLPLAGASIVVFAVGYADQLTTGTMLGSTALGFYVLAFNLSSWPVSIFSQPLRNVAPAAFARLQDDPGEMNKLFEQVLRLLAGVALPCCLLLAGAAVPVVRFVYGAEWSAAATVLSLLAVLAAVRIFFELTYDFLVVKSASSHLLIVQGVWLVVLVPALVVGAHVDGLRGVAVGQTVVAVGVVLPAYAYLLSRSGLVVRRLLAQVRLAVAVSLAVGGAALGVSHAVSSSFLACLLAGCAGLGGCAFLLWSSRDVISRLRDLRRPRVSA